MGGSQQLEIVQELMAHFGSAQAIARATFDKLAVVDGIGKTVASGLRATLELGRLLSFPDEDSPPTINSPEDAATLMMYRIK